jgi:hypothetical protein
MPVGKQRSKDKRTTTTDGPTTVHDVVREGLKSQKSSRILTGVFMETPPTVDDDCGVGYREGYEAAIEIPAKLPQALVRHWIKTHVPTAQIEEITALAYTVIEDEDQAVRWLSEPCLATDNRPPIDLIGEKNGFERVKNLLLRIEYGVLA